MANVYYQYAKKLCVFFVLTCTCYISCINGTGHLDVTYIMLFKHKISLVEHDRHHLI